MTFFLEVSPILTLSVCFAFPCSQFEGTLPASFGSLSSLVSLDISKNQLAGEPFSGNTLMTAERRQRGSQVR